MIFAVVYSIGETGRLITNARFWCFRSLTTVCIGIRMPRKIRTMKTPVRPMKPDTSVRS